MHMPFGKHQGTQIEDLPDGYLMWLYEQAEIKSPYLKRAIEEEYHARFGGGGRQGESEFWEDFFDHSRANSANSANSGALEKLAAEQPRLFLEMAEAGYRALAQRRHPDHGGTAEAMRQLNMLIEKVRQHLRSKV